MRLSHLPTSITVKGKVLNLVVGQSNSKTIAEAKAAGKIYRTVSVLNKNLRGRIDLHGKPYTDSSFVFVEDYKIK